MTNITRSVKKIKISDFIFFQILSQKPSTERRKVFNKLKLNWIEVQKTLIWTSKFKECVGDKVIGQKNTF